MQQVKWAEFELQELFEKIETNNVMKNGAGDLPATTAILSNNQIGRYISRNNATILKNVFSATANGFGKVFYQPHEFTVLQDSYAFRFKDESIDISKIHSFIIGVLNKVYSKYDWGNKSGWNKIKSEKISLPIKPNANLDKLAQIDFDFMENFISQLEAFRLSQLEAYLLVTGLKDYTLTAAEQQALADFENGKVGWGEYCFADIFNKIQQGRRLKKDDQVAGDIPFVMAGITNTGVVNYISNPVASFPKNSITIDIFGNAFYRSYDFGAGDDTGVYWNDKKELSKEMMLFLTKSAEKALAGKFSYGKKLRSSKSLNFKMQLPTNNQQPDYGFMQTLISAVQKLVIKDVVLYADRKIAATRQVIEKD